MARSLLILCVLLPSVVITYSILHAGVQGTPLPPDHPPCPSLSDLEVTLAHWGCTNLDACFDPRYAFDSNG